MLSASELDRVCIVLVRARNPSNIGAVARAMHDFGFRDLRVVNEFPVPFEAARSAVDASSVLTHAQSFATLAEAVADCTSIVGTTAVGERVLRHPLLELLQAATAMRTHLAGEPSTRIALLFGSEKTGLSNDELSHCTLLLTIPMWSHAGQRHLSMNLGQAAAVCLYQLSQNQPAEATQPSSAIPATAAAVEQVATLLHEALDHSCYTRRHPANSTLEHTRRLVRRMALDATDATVWLGILRQLLWNLRPPPD